MRRRSHCYSIVALALTLASIPAFAGQSTSLGVVVGAEQAVVAQVAAVDGTSLYDGDVISTQPNGAMRLLLGQSQVVLAGNTSILLHKAEAGVCANLLRGMVRFSSVPGSPIEIRALNSLVIRPKSDSAVIGQLSLLAPTVFEVGSNKGDFIVTLGGTDHVVAESKAYRVSLDESNDGSRTPPGKTSALWIWLPILLVAPAIVIPIIFVFESPSSPHKSN